MNSCKCIMNLSEQNNEILCPICKKICKSLRSVAKHIEMFHKKIPKDILFESNKEFFKNCRHCDIKIKHYKTDSQSRDFCNKICNKLFLTGKKQSQETIEKRILNTNQIEKEKTRQTTMMNRYNSLYECKDEEMRSKNLSNSLKGKIKTSEHINKIIESKRLNGTLKHTDETKNKLSIKMKELFNSDGFDKSKFLNNNYKNGHYKGFYTRSSYEKKFIDFSEKYKINIISAETNEFAVKYEDDDGVLRKYFPDFYLKDLDLIVEIKPLSMYDVKSNLSKFDAIKKQSRFIVISEEDYLLDDSNWNYLYQELMYV